jgi:predicted secreted protein
MTSDRRGESSTLLTRPITVSGRKLRITADAAGGRIRAGIAGSATHRLEACRPVDGAVTDNVLEWKGAHGLSAYLQKEVQIEVELQSATLYTLSFSD